MSNYDEWRTRTPEDLDRADEVERICDRCGDVADDVRYRDALDAQLCNVCAGLGRPYGADTPGE